MEKPVFKKVLQVGLVVRNLEEAIKNYELFGIGPWTVRELGPSNMKDLTVRGERVDFSMRVGLSNIGEVNWELIEPLDERSAYAEFLRERGEGLHHIAFETTEGFNETKAFFKGKGVGILQDGTATIDFAYIDSEGLLSCIAEIYGGRPK